VTQGQGPVEGRCKQVSDLWNLYNFQKFLYTVMENDDSLIGVLSQHLFGGTEEKLSRE
jgi:hypothetical protein